MIDKKIVEKLKDTISLDVIKHISLLKKETHKELNNYSSCKLFALVMTIIQNLFEDGKIILKEKGD